jgi:hypothetical protein
VNPLLAGNFSARPQSPLPRRSRASTENELSQEDGRHTIRSVVDEHEHELVGPALDIDTVAEGQRQQQELEQGEDEANDGNDGLQQEANDTAAVATVESVGHNQPSERQRLLPSPDPVPEQSHDEAGSRSDCDGDDELINNNDDSDDDGREPRPAKQKRPFSSDVGPTSKKRKHHLQRRPACPRIAHSKSHRHSPKPHFSLDRGSRVTAAFNTED